MKRFFFVLLSLFLAVSSYAQYAEPIASRGSRIIYEGQKLTKEQAATLFSNVNGEDYGGKYLQYRKGYKTGLGLSIGGASLAAVGSTVFLGGAVSGLIVAIPSGMSGNDEMVKRVDAAITAGTICAISGAAIMLAGIPTAVVYQKRIKKMASEYNASNVQKPIVTIGPARSGVGLALNF